MSCVFDHEYCRLLACPQGTAFGTGADQSQIGPDWMGAVAGLSCASLLWLGLAVWL